MSTLFMEKRTLAAFISLFTSSDLGFMTKDLVIQTSDFFDFFVYHDLYGHYVLLHILQSLALVRFLKAIN